MKSDNEVLEIFAATKGKIEIAPKVSISNREDLSIHYTPGVAVASKEISTDKSKVFTYTGKSNNIAIITDGSRVLGLGNVGPEAALPVMEGKALLFKKYGGVDAVPICLSFQDEESIVKVAKAIEPVFGAFNIEDIESPKCFRIVDRLSKMLEIPVLHDDRHGTAMVVTAGLMNALKLSGKRLEDSKIVINGAGAAGLGIAQMLLAAGAKRLYLVDRTGIIYEGRQEGMNEFKQEIARSTNKEKISGSLKDAAKGADVLIGVSEAGAFTEEVIKGMNDKPIVFALANPVPEISYDDAKRAGAFIVATGRSDFPNQVNNVLGFPSIMRGLLDARATKVDYEMLLEGAKALAKATGAELGVEHILPTPYSMRETLKVLTKVSVAIARSAVRSGNSRLKELDEKAMRSNATAMIKKVAKMEKLAARQLQKQ
ncbi:MAG: NAD(P)-dependent malic enzyme [Candidatus Micrarchaeia archaeon]